MLNGYIKGYVKFERPDGTRIPVPDAVVTAHGTTISFTSDNTGAYLLLPLIPATYSVYSEHAVYGKKTINNIVVPDGGYAIKHIIYR